MTNRYSARGSETEFETGSRGRVLRNLLGVKSVRKMAWRESEALVVATHKMIEITRRDQRFTARDLRTMRKMWLGGIYEWAGEYRQVNIARGRFMFAAATQVPRLMVEFEKGPLREHTPGRASTLEEQAHALAVVHAEFILIHPFRDGNGRCARLLAVLMALQTGLPPLDFGGIRGAEKRNYMAAVHAALAGDYGPMTAIFRRMIKRTLRVQANA